ncbi:AAA family ATPase, partial [Vibrio sinaloensis]|uniref:AAA family ATPase n=2 Tax=Photobacterium sp. (strain ATCC 43367) TaxID=379097 RepID=UPI002F3F7493
MAIEKIKLHNFRNISELDITLTPENKVVCLVGENGSSKTALLTSLVEGIVSHTRLSFPKVKEDEKLRYRVVSSSEIKSNEEFYSIEIEYSKIKGKKHTFKKLAGSKGLAQEVYSEYISGMNLAKNYFFESSTLTRSNPDEDFLFDSVFLFRPGHRFEQDGMLVETQKEWESKLSVNSDLSNRIPHYHTISHAGNDVQTILLDLFFDGIIGYEQHMAAFKSIPSILAKVTGKDFGNIQISASPNRQVYSSTIGEIKNLSQGELDLLVTISLIIRQQSFFFNKYTQEELERYGIDGVLKIPGVVLIDEVDLHLHPRAQENYMKVLTDIFPNVQFVVTTHSPFVVRGLPDHSKVIQLPTGREFNQKFGAMDIGSITNIIFEYEGGFSEETLSLFEEFKLELVSEAPQVEVLSNIYQQLRSS